MELIEECESLSWDIQHKKECWLAVKLAWGWMGLLNMQMAFQTYSRLILKAEVNNPEPPEASFHQLAFISFKVQFFIDVLNK